MVEVRSMELLLRQQKSTGVLKTNSPPLVPALPLLLSLHILPWHILFLAQSKCALGGHLRILSNRAKMEEECDGEIKEYEVATSAAKAHRCSRVKFATTYACDAAAAPSSHPSSAVLTPVSILL